MVRESGNHGRDVHPHRDARIRQARDRVEPPLRGRRPRLHPSLQRAVQRRDGELDVHGVVPRKFTQEVDVPRHSVVLGHDPDRVPGFDQHLEAATRDPEAALHGLIRVRHPAEHEHLRLPPRRGQFASEQGGGLGLRQDPALEVQSRGEPEVFVGGSRVAVRTPGLAPAVRVQTGVETEVRTVVVGDDRARSVLQNLRPRIRVGRERPGLPFDRERKEAVRRVVRASAPPNRAPCLGNSAHRPTGSSTSAFVRYSLGAIMVSGPSKRQVRPARAGCDPSAVRRGRAKS